MAAKSVSVGALELAATSTNPNPLISTTQPVNTIIRNSRSTSKPGSAYPAAIKPFDAVEPRI